MRDVYIVDYLRTAFSRSRPRQPERDVFNCYRADDLASFVYEELVKRTKINPEEIGDVLTGCAFPIGENWMYGGRTVSLLAKLPLSVPAAGIDRQCASSQTTIQYGAMEIMTGFSDIVLAGGMEHMTHHPMGEGVKPSPKLGQHPSGFEAAVAINMGLTAEKLFNEVKDKITREDMDKWSLRSHELAAKAVDEGYFKGEILPVEVTLADGTKKIIDVDQSIRRGGTMEKMAQLKPAFKRKGNITAGNSSPLNAGAAGVILMTKEQMEKYNLKPLARIVSMAVAAVDPSVMGKGPVPASKKALERAGLTVDDIDYWEINEAFAIVTLYCIDQLGIDPNKVNIKGGAIALGHPLGASGARLTGTLARILNLKKGKYGLANLCVGGGQGTAIVIERVED
ncbi:MAG: acetyl-CoA C-acetyltransferase [Candidatus Helarchaeota archaeon]